MVYQVTKEWREDGLSQGISCHHESVHVQIHLWCQCHKMLLFVKPGPNLIYLLMSVIYNACNGLKCLSLACLFKLVSLSTRQGACPSVEHLKGASLGEASAVLPNIKLGRKGLPGTNTLAYYEHL